MKLIVADLDGTIVHNKVITEQSKRIIKRLQEDYIFTVATGRHIDTALSVVKELGVTGPVITNNGAVVLNPFTNTILTEHFINPDTVKKTIDLCVKTQTPYILYKSQEIIGTKESADLLDGRIGEVNKVARIVTNEQLKKEYNDVVKILMIEYDDDKYAYLQEQLAPFKGVNTVASSLAFLDMVHENSSKGNALRTLCEYYDITLSDCLAIGDQENDLSMVQLAKTGVAMGNATQVLKQNADFITLPWEKDGFSYAMKKLVFDDLMFELTEDFVLFSDCKTIDEAIHQSKGPLLNGYINEDYVYKIQDIVTKEDYFVLLDQIAFLHVNPKYGSKEVGFSVLVLENPVSILSKQVKIVLLLSGKDDAHHLKLLKHLSLKLKNNNDELLRNVKTKQEVLRILK